MKTFLQLQQELGYRLNEPYGNEKFWSIAERKNWLNDAQLDICRKLKCLKNNVSKTVTQDKQEYSIVGDLSITDFIEIDDEGGIVYDNTTKLKRITINYLDTYQSGWRSASSGSPEFYYYRENLIGFHPKPDNSTKTIKIYYIQAPASMTNDTDYPFNNSNELTPYVDALICYAVWKAKEKEREFQEAQYWLGQYYEKLGLMRKDVWDKPDYKKGIKPYVDAWGRIYK